MALNYLHFRVGRRKKVGKLDMFSCSRSSSIPNPSDIIPYVSVGFSWQQHIFFIKE